MRTPFQNYLNNLGNIRNFVWLQNWQCNMFSSVPVTVPLVKRFSTSIFASFVLVLSLVFLLSVMDDFAFATHLNVTVRSHR